MQTTETEKASFALRIEHGMVCGYQQLHSINNLYGQHNYETTDNAPKLTVVKVILAIPTLCRENL